MEEVGVALDRMEGDVLEEADGEKKIGKVSWSHVVMNSHLSA